MRSAWSTAGTGGCALRRACATVKDRAAVEFGLCPKRAETKQHDQSLAGRSWHERAGERAYQLPDQPSGQR